MTSDQIEVESQVMKYIKFLNDKKIDISKLKAKNTAFSSIQNEFIKTIEDCISASENRIKEVRNGAVWDNLVIAFFGETNAGKSTIIETFRILFNENSNSSEIGNDGLIVGNGESDYTQIYSEYHMRINGVPFTLIDVPGIEGNESKYEKEIKEALNKAHYVFYVQGQNKRPDSGTASKIKQYLREWVRVYSIYNIKGIASKFKEPCQREILLSDSEKKIENQIEETFHEVLGDTYMGNISIQAFLAMCSKASFSSTRPDLLRGQSKLMSYFEDRDSLFSFSLFQSLINVVLQKAQNFRNEILEANKDKQKTLLHLMYDNIQDSIKEQNKIVDSLTMRISSFQDGVRNDFSNSKNKISQIASQKYASLFDRLMNSALFAIDHAVGDKKIYCQNRTNEIIKNVTSELQYDISKEISNLNSNIKQRKRDLDQYISSVNLNGNPAHVSINPDFENALNKLDFSFGDFMDFVLAGFGAVGAYFALVNIWNPLGWIAAGLTILGWLFGGRDKVAQAKEKMRNNINEAKKKNRTTYNEQISRIQNNLDNTCQQIVMSVDSDLQNIRCLHNFIKDIEGKIQLEYSKLKIKDYGCI